MALEGYFLVLGGLHASLKSKQKMSFWELSMPKVGVLNVFLLFQMAFFYVFNS
jgi:hypothetical protein